MQTYWSYCTDDELDISQQDAESLFERFAGKKVTNNRITSFGIPFKCAGSFNIPMVKSGGKCGKTVQFYLNLPIVRPTLFQIQLIHEIYWI